MTSIAQLAVWWLLTAISQQQVSSLPVPSKTHLACCPCALWTEPLSLEEFYRRWGKPELFVRWPEISPGGVLEINSLWPGQPQDQLGEWLQRDATLEDHRTPDPAAHFDGKAGSQLEGPWGSLKTNLQVDSPQTAEVRDAQRWQTDHNLQVPVAGPLYVFGQVSAGYNTWTAQSETLSSRGGVGCKLKPIAGSEIVLSGTSAANYTADPLQPSRLPVEKSQLIFELQANYSLLGALKVEYQGTAMPALLPLDHSQVLQDFRFALPLGKAGDLRLGAKHQWFEQPGPSRPWMDGMQLYIGLGLKR